MNWFRLYAESRNDAKLRSLTDAEHRVWFNLLCFASEQEERGVITSYEPDLLALEVANGDASLLTATLDRLSRLRIVSVSAEAISFIHWLDRQYDKPSDRPGHVRERVTRHRTHESNAPQPPPPPGVSSGNAPVTPSNADETRSNAPVTPSNAYTQNREYSEQRILRSEEIAPAPAEPIMSGAGAPSSTDTPDSGSTASRNAAVTERNGDEPPAALSPPPRPSRAVPKHKDAPPVAGWDYRAFWAAREEALGYPLAKAQYAPETLALNEILAEYPTASPGQIVAFLCYRRTCYGVDPASALLLARHKPHFGAWWAGGQPARQIQNGGTHAPPGTPPAARLLTVTPQQARLEQRRREREQTTDGRASAHDSTRTERPDGATEQLRLVGRDARVV